jgi:hypothetical protein
LIFVVSVMVIMQKLPPNARFLLHDSQTRLSL